MAVGKRTGQYDAAIIGDVQYLKIVNIASADSGLYYTVKLCDGISTNAQTKSCRWQYIVLPNGVDSVGDSVVMVHLVHLVRQVNGVNSMIWGGRKGTGGIGQVILLDIYCVATGYITATFQPELWFSLHIVVVSTRGIKYMTNAKLLSLRTNTCNRCK